MLLRNLDEEMQNQTARYCQENYTKYQQQIRNFTRILSNLQVEIMVKTLVSCFSWGFSPSNQIQTDNFSSYKRRCISPLCHLNGPINMNSNTSNSGYKYFNRKQNGHVKRDRRNSSMGKRLPYQGQSGVQSTEYALSAVILYYAENGLFLQAYSTWEQLINSSFVPSIQFMSKLFDAYGVMGHFDGISLILDDMKARNFHRLPEVYSLAIACFGKQGQLESMKDIMEKMISMGYSVDSTTANVFVMYYSIFGSLKEMEYAYGRLKRSRILLEKEGIKAMSSAYIKEKKFYQLGEFLRDLGLGRRDVGNLLWNLLLLSYAANFKMKSLQREFLSMVDAGFHPDITTFNIRALAFSSMSLLWDLHLSLEHMMHENIPPDLVTYGCVIDAYVEKRLVRNLEFVLTKMNLDDYPNVNTDPIVFEALGKGGFHASSEANMEYRAHRPWTYRELTAIYMKKQYRKNQIFWNY